MNSKRLRYLLLAIAFSIAASSLFASVCAQNPYDVDGDDDVDIYDIGEAAIAFGSYDGHTRWNADADVDGDMDVDIKDIVLIARNFGT